MYISLSHRLYDRTNIGIMLLSRRKRFDRTKREMPRILFDDENQHSAHELQNNKRLDYRYKYGVLYSYVNV